VRVVLMLLPWSLGILRGADPMVGRTLFWFAAHSAAAPLYRLYQPLTVVSAQRPRGHATLESMRLPA
jgi:hypothetical protein